MKARLLRLMPWWQVLFLLLSSTWLLAPYLNHGLAARTTLISQYEVPGQPYALWFRLADLTGGLLLASAGYIYRYKFKSLLVSGLVTAIGIGMALDPALSTNCRFIDGRCVEYFSPAFVLHAAETTFTAAAVFGLALYDAWRRKALISYLLVLGQVGYFSLFLTDYVSRVQFNTLAQFIYQLTLLIYLAWLCRDYLRAKEQPRLVNPTIVKYTVAGWAFINGVAAIAISLGHLNLAGRFGGLYFASDTAWLAQHRVIIGVVMLYLSRHLARGERRASQLFLVITFLEVLKYSTIEPNAWLAVVYWLTFCLLFGGLASFDRGTTPLTWRLRARDFIYVCGGLLASVLAALLLLDRDDRTSRLAHRAWQQFSEHGWVEKLEPHTRLESTLLAHTISIFILSAVAALLWTLFRPSRTMLPGSSNRKQIRAALAQHSRSTEDIFKLWPNDKQYFWRHGGFVAYKIVGPVAFALADPVGASATRGRLVADFTAWARAAGLRVCFLPVYTESLAMYQRAGLNTLQIGASAVILIDNFVNQTANDKWWRWQKNRAAKAGYQYHVAQPPHQPKLLAQLQAVSDSWLTIEGHKERGFALGHFDKAYLQKCTLHYLTDEQGRLIAFCNQLPQFKKDPTATIDMLRYEPGAPGAMPYLLFKTIEQLAPAHTAFDLGFVPFAAVNNRALQVAKTLSAGRFSAKGLEQFKNKFDPSWQPNHLAYDGDLADLAIIGLNLEKAMELHPKRH